MALALAIIFPMPWIALGVFSGSFLLNFGQATNQFEFLQWSMTVAPIKIASGATLQLIAGYCLFKKLVGTSNLVDVPKSIVRFSLIVTPISCLIASTFGTSALLINGIITNEEVMFTWLTWWIGDAIGILLFTPMLIVLFSSTSIFSKRRKLQVILPSSIIFIATCLLFIWSQENRKIQVDDVISDYANQYSHKINEQLSISKNKLLSYQAYFQGSNSVTFKEFNKFSSVLLGGSSILHGVGWTEIIEHKDRASKEKELQLQGYKDFLFKQPNKIKEMIPSQIKNIYYPIIFIFPLKTNEKAHGLDLGSLPDRLNILKDVQRTSKGQATPPIQLVQGNESQAATILYLPVWKKYPDNTHLLGYVSGVYIFNNIVRPVLDLAEKEEITFKMSDITNASDVKPIIQTNVDLHRTYSGVSKTVSFANRDYLLEFYPTSHFDLGSKDWVSWLILIIGFILSALFQAFILMVTGTIEYTSRMVEKRTKELRVSKEKSQFASKAKSMFLANMSHELRTPLNAIIGLINLCLKTNLNDVQSRYLEQSKLASETLMLLINQTLDFAKIESGKLELESIEFDLSLLLSKLHAIFSIQSKSKNVEFNLQADSKLPVTLVGDALRLEQVLLNLLSNAFKFTDKGSVSLSLSVDVVNDVELLNFSVKDTGVGISSSQQKYIFQSFRQADNSTTRKFGGTGLGLAISKQIIDLMDGSIELISTEGHGCEFKVSIPLITPKASAAFTVEDMLVQNTGSKKANKTIIQKDSLKGINILLVEDIQLNRMIATELLESHGASVTQAVDGQDAINKLEAILGFNIVLMDIQMPVLDGYAATAIIRSNEDFQYLPIVAMTANAMQEDIDKCMAVGMNGHIAKPIDEENMLLTILSVIKSHAIDWHGGNH
ncbi:hypothetical protein NBRC116188_25350 [Oceaniserpentilla sp. 4NH20-0058]